MRADPLRHLVCAMCLAAALAPLTAGAQSSPQPSFNRPIQLVLGTPPGGSVDALARQVSQFLTPVLGVPLVVQNRPGGSNKIAMDFVARSAPDGYTLMLLGSSTPLVEAAAISSGGERPYDTLRDFVPVGMLISNTYALVVNASMPVKNVGEFIALARRNPGAINYGSSGVAKSDHVAAELFSQGTRIRMLHVPYKGLGEAINDLVPGRIDAIFSAAAPMAPHIRAGKLRILGIVGGQRSKLFPDVPTIADAVPLPGFRVDTWNGLMAPAKTPPAVINRLNAEIGRMLRDDGFVSQRLLPIGLEPFPTTPEQMSAMFRAEVEKYTKLFKDLGIKLD